MTKGTTSVKLAKEPCPICGARFALMAMATHFAWAHPAEYRKMVDDV